MTGTTLWSSVIGTGELVNSVWFCIVSFIAFLRSFLVRTRLWSFRIGELMVSVKVLMSIPLPLYVCIYVIQGEKSYVTD